MSQRKLASFYGSFHGRTEAVLRDFSLAPPTPYVEFDGVSMARVLSHSRGFLVNRLSHLWGEFCRHVVVASALGGYRTLNGVLLTSAPQIGGVPDILTAIGATSMTGPGLNWGYPTWTVKRVSTIQPANRNHITLGIGSAPFEEFRCVRNFVIHSNPHTRSEFDAVAATYSLVGVLPDDLLRHRLPGGGTVMESWIRKFQMAALEVVR